MVYHATDYIKVVNKGVQSRSQYLITGLEQRMCGCMSGGGLGGANIENSVLHILIYKQLQIKAFNISLSFNLFNC